MLQIHQQINDEFNSFIDTYFFFLLTFNMWNGIKAVTVSWCPCKVIYISQESC